MKVVALIPSAGVGKRMGARTSKQFLDIDNRPILAQTLSRFEESQKVTEVYIVVSKKEETRCRRDIVERYNLKKVVKIVIGGMERQDSVKNGLDAVGSECDIVMIHDGVRPFVTSQLIDEAISNTCLYDATVVAVPVKDTVKTISPHGEIVETLEREKIWLAQTPQTFKYDIIKRAYKNAYDNNIYGTDDSYLVELLGIKVRIIRGTYENMKITTPEDLVVARAFFSNQKKQSTQ